MSTPEVSIVLPTRNGGPFLAELLDALDAQQGAPPHELVAVDSGSTDGTLELLERRADRLLRVAPEDFDHGATRNLAIEASQGEFIVLLVQDALPASEDWLAELIRPLRGDARVAGTFARQLPRADASRLTRWALARWVAAQEEPYVSEPLGAAQFEALAPSERFLRCVFDNVCSCLRRAAWREHPFRPTPIAEDLEWARAVLLDGWRIAYTPRAMVVHSHERSPRYELRRTELVHRRLHELFGVRTIPTARALLTSLAVTWRDHWRVLRQEAGPSPSPAEGLRAMGLALAWPLGQYLGGRAAERGAAVRRFRGV